MTARGLLGLLTTALVIACSSHPAAAPTSAGLCPVGSFPIAGVCLSDDDAQAYCGKGARPEGGGCAPLACSDGAPLDLASGECVPVLELRRLEGGEHGAANPDAGLGCVSPEAGLIVEGDSLACIPHAQSCGRGARWRDGACHADPVCPLGAIVDGDGACVTVLRKGRGAAHENVLDVGAWIRVVLGPDGGEGSASLCGPMTERPWRAGVISHGTAVVDIQVDLVFPDNEVKAAHVSVSAKKHFDGVNMDAPQPVPAGRYMEPLWNALRALGGVSTASTASVRVHCPIDGGTDTAGAQRSESAPTGGSHRTHPPKVRGPTP